MGYWAYGSYQLHRDWTSALDALRAEPGILVMVAERDGTRAFVRGLRDPLARDPATTIPLEALERLHWDWNWHAFLSAEPRFVLARARHALQPPPMVSLSFDDGVLVLSGEAAPDWVEDMRRTIASIPGVSAYRDEVAMPADPRLEQRAQLELYRRQIDTTALLFDVNSVQLDPAQEAKLDELAAAISALGPIAQALDLAPRYLVTGYADASGSQATNRRLSFSRALVVTEALVNRGIDEGLFFAPRMGFNPPDPARGGLPEDRARNRRVRIELVPLGAGYSQAER